MHGAGRVNLFENSLSISLSPKAIILPKQKQPPEVIYRKKLLFKLCNIHRKTTALSLFLITLQAFRTAIVLKRDSSTDAFLRIL